MFFASSYKSSESGLKKLILVPPVSYNRLKARPMVGKIPIPIKIETTDKTFKIWGGLSEKVGIGAIY
jgi:hypothetical protein